MTNVGQIERKTQERVVALFRDALGYDYLGNWIDRPNNANVEHELLHRWLKNRGVDAALITRALYLLNKAANDTSKSLYDRNRAVYDLLRYGVRVKPDVGDNTETVWLVDWKNPDHNHFAIAEEVAVAAPDPKAFGKRPDVVLYVNGIALGVLELIHDFVVFDAGTKKLCRHNQYFGVRAAREHVRRREGGIVWHTQGSGKSLTMVWLARWIRENVTNSRVLIVTDRFVALMSEYLPSWKVLRDELNRAPLGRENWNY